MIAWSVAYGDSLTHGSVNLGGVAIFTRKNAGEPETLVPAVSNALDGDVPPLMPAGFDFGLELVLASAALTSGIVAGRRCRHSE